MELFTFALVIWVIYPAWRSGQRVRSLTAVRMEAKELGGKADSDDPVEYERRTVRLKYVKKAAAEEVLDLYGRVVPADVQGGLKSKSTYTG